MKRRFLYKKSYDQIGDDLKALISEEDYNNIVWKLEVRPINNDHFIRNIGF
jgi:hypothetical protein